MEIENFKPGLWEEKTTTFEINSISSTKRDGQISSQNYTIWYALHTC